MIERNPPLASVQPPPWNPDRRNLAETLEPLPVDRQQAGPASGVKGMLPYATLVRYERGR
jgi:sigma-E factor negative regulatory protein RseA